jgi:hypothetical protein
MNLLARVFPWALVAYIVVMTALSVAGAGLPSHYLDEYVHIDKLRNFLEYGMYSWKVAPDSAGNPVNISGHLYVYGPIFSIIGHILAVTFGAETWSTVAVNDTAFVARHLTSTLFASIAVFATGWAVALVTRSKTWGLVASAILVSIPLWTASATYNVKDVPAAAGFTLFTAGCIAFTRGAERQNRRAHITTWLALFGGALIVWGIRPGLWILFALALVGMWLVGARLANFRDLAPVWRSLLTPVSAIAAGYAVMLAVYPLVFSNPFRLLIKSFTDTSDFATRRASLTNGVMPTQPPSWTFLPQWLGAQLPEVLLVLLAVSAGVAVWLVVRRVLTATPHKLDGAITAIVFVVIQLAAFPIAAIILHSKITSGIRQFLFILPAAAMLIAIVLWALNGTLAWKRIRSARIVVVALLVASTALTTVLQFQLFPYQANYFNPTTFSRGIEGRWELDRYGVSAGELYSLLNADERAHCINCATIDYPSLDKGAPSTATGSVAFDRVIILANGPTAQAGCRIVRSVTRPYLWSALHIRAAKSCPIRTVPFTGTVPTAESERSAFWRAITQWGWATAGTDGAVSKPGTTAALAWTVDSSALPTTYRLGVSVGEGSAESVIVHVVVNGSEVSNVAVPVGGATPTLVTIPVQSPTAKQLVIVELRLTRADGTAVTNRVTVSSLDELG